MVRQDDYVLSLIITECWRQGSDFGNSQIPLLILGCLANRQRLGWGAFLDVLKSVPKFSSVLVQPNRDKFPEIWDPSFIKILHAAGGICDGSVPNPALEGLYWADLSQGLGGVTNPWFRDKVLNSAQHSACCNQGPFTVFR